MSTQPPGWPGPQEGWPGQPVAPAWPTPAGGSLPPAPGRRRKVPRWTLLILAAVAVAATLIVVTQRRGGLMDPYELGIRSPFTPEQAKEQVIEAAKEIVSVAAIPVEKGTVYLDSCNDQGEAPFQGAAVIHYPLAQGAEAAQNDTATFLRALQGAGWTVLPSQYPKMPPTDAQKDGVTASFEVQGEGRAGRVITVRGECRDVTTTRDTRPSGEPIPGL